MHDQQISALLRAFGITRKIQSWKPFGHGHINDTYLVQTEAGVPDYIIQRKNHLIFKDIPGMLRNITLVTNHIRAKLLEQGEPEPDRKVMKYLEASDGSYYVLDDTGNYWTLFLFISGSHTIEEVTNPDQAYSAGKAFGNFQMQLADLDGRLLIESIPQFHNGPFRFEQFLEAIRFDRANRCGEMKPVIDQLLERRSEMLMLQTWLDQGELPIRITHNDSKINNILFDEADRQLCIIDLDTVMPGSILFDFGDAIRTLGNSAAEDEAELSKISFRKDYFQAYTRGYLSESKMFLTEKEKSNLVYSCRYMVWEQAIRFLTDYLNGDIYYKIGYPDHNKIRTLSQLRYLEVLEENAMVMEQIVNSAILP